MEGNNLEERIGRMERGFILDDLLSLRQPLPVYHQPGEEWLKLKSFGDATTSCDNYGLEKVIILPSTFRSVIEFAAFKVNCFLRECHENSL